MAATPQAQQLRKDIEAEFGDAVRIDSGTVVRRINRDPTKAWSQHSWGNAIDIHADKPTLDRVYQWLSRRRSQLGELVYGDAHHQTHIHVSPLPRRTGTPPGAPGVGVTGGTGGPADSTIRIGFTDIPVEQRTAQTAGVAFSGAPNLSDAAAEAWAGGDPAPFGGLKLEVGLIERILFGAIGIALLLGGGSLLSKSLATSQVAQLIPARPAKEE